jgi:hypothetical protein
MAQQPPNAGAAATSSQTTADAIQLAIGLLTASVDSPELQALAFRALAREDPAALGDLLAGLDIVSQLLLHQLHQATGQPLAATLQTLAIVAETSRDTPRWAEQSRPAGCLATGGPAASSDEQSPATTRLSN